ncbi:putative O-antigen polymerase [Hyphomonas johnsonii MHS-2]|uniref:Putative O-antigen polymerase n=2 Tax=Hyphomonas johnsonii TaxID=81031 RepID=A0A059FVL1_9PROT|nr:putative O-antigen polymerase [Hyphomonas johnsonii MHS-2]
MNMVKPIQVNEKKVLGFANLYRTGRKAPVWEQALVTIWFFVTYLPLDGVTPIRYLMVAYFIGIAGMYYRDVLPVVLKAWPLFLLPILGLLSFMWSDYPSEAIRSGVLMLLTPLTIVVIGARLNTRQVLRCLMFAGIMTAIYAVPSISTFAIGGPYGSGAKNLLAIQMLFAMLLSLATALNQKEFLWIRLVAAPFVPICFVFQYMAHSATSLVFAVVGIVGLLTVRYLWMSIGRIRHLRTSILMASVTLALTAAVVVLNMPENTIEDDFLNMLGKDSTFSGRSAIWREAALVSQENPVWGVGLESFWQYDVGAAQTLNENDFKPFGTKLSFHSSFWEVRVHLGIVGLSLFLLIIGWCSYRTLWSWFRTPTMDTSALVITAVIILTSTFTESYLWSTFNTLVNLLYFGAVTTLGAGKRVFQGRVPVIIQEAS